jgi:hypothetical protein
MVSVSNLVYKSSFGSLNPTADATVCRRRWGGGKVSVKRCHDGTLLHRRPHPWRRRHSVLRARGSSLLLSSLNGVTGYINILPDIQCPPRPLCSQEGFAQGHSLVDAAVALQLSARFACYEMQRHRARHAKTSIIHSMVV